MAMSKKDYVSIADATNTVLWMPGSCPITVGRMVAALSAVFTADNPRFDETRFRIASMKPEG
jgi:hypothetical protein